MMYIIIAWSIVALNHFNIQFTNVLNLFIVYIRLQASFMNDFKNQ